MVKKIFIYALNNCWQTELYRVYHQNVPLLFKSSLLVFMLANGNKACSCVSCNSSRKKWPCANKDSTRVSTSIYS